jgi:hypothetical protein
MFVGLGLVALWIYVRLPALRPRSIARAFAHVVLSFGLMLLLPLALGAFFATLAGRTAVLSFVLGVLMPALCYLLVSWFWLLGCIVGHVTGGTPRGGHPASADAR